MKEYGKVKFLGKVTKTDEMSQIEISPEYCEGAYRLEEFSHLIVLYWFHQRDNDVDRSTLRVVPRRHEGAPEVGVFASRSPSRPNPIGFCIAESVKVEGCKIFVRSLDALEGSPVIDIKPYIPRADAFREARTPDWTLFGPSG